MAKKIKKGIPWFLILAVIGLMVSFNWMPKVLEVKADEASTQVTSDNLVPEASGTSFSTPIVLNEYTTKDVAITGTVTDNNSCKDLTSVKVALYKDGTTCTSAANADNDVCYFWEDSSPANDASCTGDDDTDYAVNHTFSVQYYADAGDWKATVTPADEGAGTAHTFAGALNELKSLNVENISYGSVNPGSNSTGDHTSTVTNTGNIAIDVGISGTAMTCATRGSIPIANQEYAVANFNYGDGTDLSGDQTDWNLDLPIPEDTNVPVTDVTYWQVGVPAGTEGVCSGTNTFTAITVLP